MGNGQSAEAAPRPPNKLSKPRTNTSTTNLLNSKSTAPPSRRNSQLGDGAKRYSMISVDSVGDVSDMRESRQKKRRSMFRSKSAQPKSEPLQIGNGVDIEFLDRSPTKNQSTGPPMTHESPDQPYHAQPAESRPPARPSRMSLQHVPYAQHHPRLSLVAEAPSPQADQLEGSKRRSKYVKEPKQVEKRRSQYLQEEDSPQALSGLPERKNSEPEIFAPIRRRSLQQHGIATRKSWAVDDARESLPSQTPSDKPYSYYYDPEKPEVSPLSSIVKALAPKFEDIAPGPRTRTPDDLDYGHIGAFKLGSLRITNGTPSPSFDRPATREGDYFIGGQGNTHSHRGLKKRSNTISAPQEMIRSPWVARAESPLRQAHVYEPEERRLTVNTHLPLPEFSAFNFTTESPTKSLDLAHEYMQDLALSPFSFDNSPPHTPRLESTSKHTAIEDELFEAEPRTPNMDEIHAPRSFDSGYQAENAQIQYLRKSATETTPKPLAKADSGYSSNLSIRSFKENAAPAVPAKEAPPIPPKESVSRVSSSSYSITSSYYSEVSEPTIRSKRSLPALPTEEMPPPFRQAPPVPLKHSSVQNSGKQIQAPPLPHKSPEQQWAAASSRPHKVVKPNHVRQQSLPAVKQSVKNEFTPSHSPPGSKGSSYSSTSTSRWRKDKKRRQSMQPQPVYTVQAFRAEEISVPPIPTEVSRHLEERVDGFPVACFPNTFTSSNHLRRTLSKETLGTIFSVGSAENREEPTFARLHSALPPVPQHATIPEIPSPTTSKQEANRRYTYQPTGLPAASVSQARSRQSLQMIKRKAAPVQGQSQQAFENHITSYDSVSSSIGKSPYDIALGPKTQRPTVQERAKSMTYQLEAEARERFERARSASYESLASEKLVKRRISYDSVANKTPFASSVAGSRQSTRGRPPQAHAKWTGVGTGGNMRSVVRQRSNPNLADDGRTFSIGQDRVKSPPPVSMQTQRKMTPTQAGPQISPTVGLPSLPPQLPSRAPPQPPSQFSPPLQQQHDPWANQKNFWAGRRKSAGEALQGRQSAEMQRPDSARLIFESELGQQELNRNSSWDASRWDGYGAGTSSYDHTYGSYSDEQNKENRHHHPLFSHPVQNSSQNQSLYQEEDYYDGPSEEFERFEQELPQTIHRRQTSTSEMLILDRFAGGLDYGYEPGAGLGGSAGTRNVGNMAAGGRKSVDVSMRYGVDFSDIPIFLQRVKVQT